MSHHSLELKEKCVFLRMDKMTPNNITHAHPAVNVLKTKLISGGKLETELLAIFIYYMKPHTF